MVTKSLVMELAFISKVLNESVRAFIKIGIDTSEPIELSITNGYLEVYYLSKRVWRENLSSPSSNFDIESVQNIYKCISLLSENSADWEKYKFIEN